MLIKITITGGNYECELIRKNGTKIVPTVTTGEYPHFVVLLGHPGPEIEYAHTTLEDLTSWIVRNMESHSEHIDIEVEPNLPYEIQKIIGDHIRTIIHKKISDPHADTGTETICFRFNN
jgi:hypothetical protein